MPYHEFIWTERALQKLADNGVTTEEFEAAVMDPVQTEQSRSSGRPAAVGYAHDGRRIFCVYEVVDEVLVVPVTGYFIERK